MIGAMAASCGDTRFAIVGYSQGADAAVDLAAEIGTGIGMVPPTRVEGVGLLSDPRRSESDVLIGPAVGGNGASGPRIGGFGWLSGKTVTLCAVRSEEHTSELQSLMRISYAVLCLKKDN